MGYSAWHIVKKKSWFLSLLFILLFIGHGSIHLLRYHLTSYVDLQYRVVQKWARKAYDIHLILLV